MSFLTPLYVLGALAVAAPILFHLIRRSPRGEVPFGSLMFLSPTPPRLTRRSRLDNIALLLLRAAALLLLALAFARPFLRQPARLDFGDAGRRRVAVVIDTSASMRRAGLWAEAQELAAGAIAACGPGDQLAVFAFDTTTRPLLGFAESATLDPARRRAVAGGLVRGLKPTWGSTNLGQALVDAVAAIEDVTDSGEKAGRMPRRVVLVSDLQQGSRLDALGDFEWPSDVELDLKTVSDPRPNASLQWAADAPEGSAPGEARGTPRVRVSNDPGAAVENFRLSWWDGRDPKLKPREPVAAYVPSGESRVVRVPRPEGAWTLRLTGDAHDFDNTIYLAPERKDESTVLYVGNDAADDPAGMLYYLLRVFEDSSRRGVRVVAKPPTDELTIDRGHSTPLVVLAAETTPANAGRLRAFALGGGTVLDVVAAPGRAATLAAVADVAPWVVDDAAPGRDTLLGEIAFDHPLFAPLAGPQFNDFTKIHFWKYRRVDARALGAARVVARFENGDAAVVDKPVGKGRIVVMASGWGPADSQLARSSKFVPLMASLLGRRSPGEDGSPRYLVGERLPMPDPGDSAAGGRVVHKPDDATARVPAGVDFFPGTDQPGVYTVETPAGARSFAVNLDPAEGKTSPLLVETLEQFGCRLARPVLKAADRDERRQMQNVELENRQKLWRWLILSAVGILIVETWLAGRLSRTRPARAGVRST